MLCVVHLPRPESDLFTLPGRICLEHYNPSARYGQREWYQNHAENWMVYSAGLTACSIIRENPSGLQMMSFLCPFFAFGVANNRCSRQAWWRSSLLESKIIRLKRRWLELLAGSSVFTARRRALPAIFIYPETENSYWSGRIGRLENSGSPK